MVEAGSLESLRGRDSNLQEAKLEAEKVVLQHQAAFDAALSNLKEMFNVSSLEEGEARLSELKLKVSELSSEVEALVASAEAAISSD